MPESSAVTPTHIPGHVEQKLWPFSAKWWHRWNKIKPFWELAVVILTIVMLWLAIKQYRDSHNQLEKINRVSERISTKYLRDFPSTLGPIAHFISQTEDHLDVMVDFLGYGDFSAPSDFETLYLSALKKLCMGKKIRLIVYDDQVARTALTRQFPNDKNGEIFSKLKKSQTFKDYFAEYHKTVLRGSSYSDFISGLSYEQFINLLIDGEHDHQKELENLKSAEIHYAHGPQFAVLLWIRDGRDAIFSFPFTDEELLQQLSADPIPSKVKALSGDKLLDRLSKEVTFQSSDRDLIDVFNELFEEEWRRSKK